MVHTDPWTGPARELADRIVAFIDSSLDASPTERFEDLALAIHAYQAEHCPVVARLTEPPVQSWLQIPAVPVDVFKQLPVGTVSPEDASATFLTSGTTGGGRGTHRLRSTALYEHGALRWAQRCVGAWPARSANLLLDPARHPESSLSHMVRLFADDASWHLTSKGVRADSLRDALGDRPAFIGATAFALAEWLEHHTPEALPDGCVLMVTGGFKGRVHRLDATDLYQAAAQVLRPQKLVTEYGMTELSSQLWAKPGEAYRPPPWLRVVAIDPLTGEPRPAGQAGQLRLYDLCNLDGSVAIETMDEGIVTEEGTLWLNGRLTDAPARGCSLTVEEAWLARRSTP
ncbi:MAG: acyl-protein synthetase [Myxococcota bacterium]